MFEVQRKRAVEYRYEDRDTHAKPAVVLHRCKKAAAAESAKGADIT